MYYRRARQSREREPKGARSGGPDPKTGGRETAPQRSPHPVVTGDDDDDAVQALAQTVAAELEAAAAPHEAGLVSIHVSSSTWQFFRRGKDESDAALQQRIAAATSSAATGSCSRKDKVTLLPGVVHVRWLKPVGSSRGMLVVDTAYEPERWPSSFISDTLADVEEPPPSGDQRQAAVGTRWWRRSRERLTPRGASWPNGRCSSPPVSPVSPACSTTSNVSTASSAAAATAAIAAASCTWTCSSPTTSSSATPTAQGAGAASVSLSAHSSTFNIVVARI